MQQNQKYFALRDDAGRLLNRFLLVSHLETPTVGDRHRQRAAWCRPAATPSSSATRDRSARWMSDLRRWST